MLTLKDVREGSVVIVCGGFGTEPAKRATVTYTDSDIKNGYAGIDYITDDGDERWAYLTQVQRVVQY
jgi:hypothetical protein